MARSNLIKISGLIQDISPVFGDCCQQNVTLLTTDGIINLIISSETYVVDEVMLRRGMSIAAFYDSMRPVVLIFPPRFQAEIIAVVNRNQSVDVNFFNNRLVAADNSLQLNVGRNTRITTANGQNFNCNISNRLLMVFYTVTTRSIPPQTSPDRIIVLC